MGASLFIFCEGSRIIANEKTQGKVKFLTGGKPREACRPEPVQFRWRQYSLDGRVETSFINFLGVFL